MSTPQIDAVIAQLKEKDFAIRRETLTTLREIADADAVATIIALLQDPDWVIRARAAEALGEICDPCAVPGLVATLQDQNTPAMETGIHRVYDCAAKALGKIGTAPAIFALRGMLETQDLTVRFRIARALLEAGDATAATVLIPLIQHPDVSMRLNVLRVLGETGVTEAVPALITMLNAPNIPAPLQVAAAEALLALGSSETLPCKVLACAQFSARERITILESLRRLRYRGDAPATITIQYAFPETAVLCRRALRDEDATTRDGAQTVLNWLNGDRDLLIASQPDPTAQSGTLLRATQGSAPETRPDTLLMASQAPTEEETPPVPAPPRPFWKRRRDKA